MAKIRVKNKKDICSRCGKEFYHYSWDNQRLCSSKCINHKVRIECICVICGKKLSKPKSAYERNYKHYCSRKCYNSRVNDIPKRIKRHTEYYINLVKSGCIGCKENRYYLLQIHHIDSDRNNNKPRNLEVVCGNCHIKRHLKIDKFGKLSYHPSSLTDRNLLKEL
jgi:hypothetical protein